MSTTTKLSIQLTSGGALSSPQIPTREGLQAVSELYLENGEFTPVDMKLRVDQTGVVEVTFRNAQTLAISVTGTYVVATRQIVFPQGRISLTGLGVALPANPSPTALVGIMSHRRYTGVMEVASTGDPLGDRLPQNVEQRDWALVP